jgi:PHD/YefM family antitoxin component YafN of YafNO toxin-antitoxin module
LGRLPGGAAYGILHIIDMNSTVTISELQAQTPRIVRETERQGMTAVTRHGRIAAFLISKDRVEAMIETMEILSDSAAMRSIREFESGKMKLNPVECLDED